MEWLGNKGLQLFPHWIVRISPLRWKLCTLWTSQGWGRSFTQMHPMIKVSNNGPRKWSASNKCLYERKPVVNQLWPPKWWQHFTIRVFMSKIECLRCRGSFLSFHLKQTGIVPTQCRGQAWRMITTDKWDSTFWLTSWISAEELLLLEVGIKTTLGVVHVSKLNLGYLSLYDGPDPPEEVWC